MEQGKNRSHEDYANWSLSEVEEVFRTRKGNSDRFLRRPIKEDKSTLEHKDFKVKWNGIAYSNELLPLDTDSLREELKVAQDKKRARHKKRNFESSINFKVPDKTIVGFVYLIRFTKGYYYIGETQNLNERMKQHKARWKRKVMDLVNRRTKKVKPDDLPYVKEPKIRADKLLEAIKQYFVKSGEITKGTRKITDAIRKGKITEKQLDSALKDITTNQVVLLDVQIEGVDDESRLFNFKASERWHIGFFNSKEYELINYNFADYSLMETANLMKNKEHNFKYPWEATLAEAPVGYHYEINEEWDEPW